MMPVPKHATRDVCTSIYVHVSARSSVLVCLTFTDVCLCMCTHAHMFVCAKALVNYRNLHVSERQLHGRQLSLGSATCVL